MSSTISDTSYLASISHLLENYFAKFPLDRDRVPVLLKQLADNDNMLTDRKNTPGHLTASALVYSKEDNTVLLIKHKFLDRWLQPGGHLDFEEAPLLGAARELLEETGLTLPLHPWHQEAAAMIPIDVDSHQIPVNAAKGEGEHEHHDFQYIYVLDEKAGSAVTLQVEEVDKYKWAPLAEVATGVYGKRLKRVVERFSTENL